MMRSGQAGMALGLAERFAVPWIVNYLHVAQMENLLVRLQLEGSPAQRRTGTSIAALWRARLAEAVFVVENPPWDDAWRLTIGFHRDLVSPVPQPSHLLHLAAAQLTGASHYLSLHSPARRVAQKLGFQLLPDTL